MFFVTFVVFVSNLSECYSSRIFQTWPVIYKEFRFHMMRIFSCDDGVASTDSFVNKAFLAHCVRYLRNFVCPF